MAIQLPLIYYSRNIEICLSRSNLVPGFGDKYLQIDRERALLQFACYQSLTKVNIRISFVLVKYQYLTINDLNLSLTGDVEDPTF